MVSGAACTACASVGLPPCFSEAGCAYDGLRHAPVSLTRPTGKKAPRRPGMPESARLASISSQSQPIGEFLDWLAMETEYHLAVYDDESGTFRASHPPIQRLLARYFGIDLERVERERRRLLAYIRAKGNT